MRKIIYAILINLFKNEVCKLYIDTNLLILQLFVHDLFNKIIS